ncbi:hypothetical protein PFY10_06990 [Chryseobacterium daecheongense]|nr:hypothetical protein PFY10_06990 [Chryseobacterium daecheongense]
MKKIDITKLENLSKQYKSTSKEDQHVTFEASRQGGFYVYEKTENADITTSVSKKDSEIIEITKTIKNSKDNTTELYTYLPDGTLQMYLKSQNSTTIQNNKIGEVFVDRYVEVIEKFDTNNLAEVRTNYNAFFEISLQEIITTAEKNSYRDISVYRLYLDDDLLTIPVLGLTLENFLREKPYWIIGFRESTTTNTFILRIYDGISGDFIAEQTPTIFSKL